MDPSTATYEFPVSFAQQRLWFLEQLEGIGPAYTIRLPVRLRGPLRADLLQQALDQLVQRHEALRTTIRVRQGEPVQVVAEQLHIGLEILPMEGTSAPELRRRVGELSAHGFDVARGPLLRAILLRVSADEHVLLVLMHHAIADAWSSGILFRDLAEFYAALLEDRGPALPALAVQYGDFADWQRNGLPMEELQRQQAFWKNALAGAPPLLELPTDHPRPAAQTFRGSRWTHILPAELAAALRELGAGQGCTMFMTLLAAFDVLLHRHSGCDDILVGTPVAGRGRSELEQVIGCFASTLVMRADLGGRPAFVELLARVKRAALDAWAHQDLPFEKLVEAVQPPRSLSYSPVFQVMFTLQNVPWEAAAMPGLEVSPAETDAPPGAKFDLSLSVTEYGGELWLAFEYNTDLFEQATVAAMGRHFEALLRGAVARPEMPVDELPLADAAELEPPSPGPGETADAMAQGIGIHERIGRIARQYPAAMAIECGDERWTYAELEDRADTLADRLRAQGAGPGAIVAICLERSAQMVATLLAVLKSGAAYLPLDPAFPPGRLQFMLDDSGAGWLVTSRFLAAKLPVHHGRSLCVEDLAPAACAAAGPPGAPVAADQLAYLIYTSGSTGKPKGVRITHAGVVNFLDSMRQEPGLSPADRMLAVTTLSFDIAVLELLGPLWAGGTVVMAGAAEARDAAALARRLETARITVMQATPATWRMLLAGGWRGRPGLRVLCGGEALDADLARQLLPRCGELWNLYGPTETTIWSSCARIGDPARISVGRPIANTRFCVMDAAGRPVPQGVPGELWIGGAGVSPGYHQRAELTADRFVAHPQLPGMRLYRSGDRARVLADGRLQILGRMDAQVKLRGFRIEPGEIENVLMGVPGVSAGVVGLREAATGDQRLVAWVVPAAAAGLAVAGLRAVLQRQLPDYMLPTDYVLLDVLPLTPNGKLDRRRLPAPEFGRLHEAYAAPRNPVEEVLCGLFADILQAGSAMGIHDDFFARGGHSLLATRLVSRIRDVLEVELPLKALFESPSPAALAAQLPMAAAPVRAVIRRQASASAPLSYAQRRLWFLEQLEPGNPAYNLHAAFTLQGDLNREALGRALNALVDRHESLRTTFTAVDGEPRQAMAPQLPLSVQILECMALSAEALDAELARLAEEPFDLARGPLLRASLLVRGHREHILVLAMHHIVSDGWSMAVLLRELASAYGSYIRGEQPEFHPLPVQYGDFARWQQRWLSEGELATQLAYWREQLRDAPRLIRLPADRPRLPLQRYRGARLQRDVPAALSGELHQLARQEDGTLFMVLFAAFATVLARYGGDEDLAIGTPVAGRNRTELEGLIGFFINTLVLRADLSGNPAFRELLARVRRTALDAYAHGEVPLERLVEELRPPRDPGRTPLFQVMFNLHNEPAQQFQLDGLQVTRLGLDRRTAKFDLTVGIVEHARGLAIGFEYNTDLFDRETASAMADSYVQLLREVARDPGQTVGAINLLDDAARMRVQAECRRTGPPPVIAPGAGPRPGDTLVAGFAEQVARGPDRLAVSWARGATLQRWSYADLNRHARSLAGQLLAQRVRDPVALMLGHDGVMVAAVLGVLQAGLAYVPLDPYAPASRNRQVLADAGAGVIVTDAPRLAAAPWVADCGLPLVHADAPRTDALRTDAPPGPAPHPDAPAYILYTSGTTGVPKGVVQTQGRVLGQVSAWSRPLGIGEDDRLALFSGYGFDAAVQDIFGALLNGASLHPVDLRGGQSAPEIVDHIAAQGLTLLHFTPTVYRYLFGGRVTCEQDLSKVRLVVLGGEQARRSDLDLFRLRFRRGARLVNGLGLTESSAGLQFFADHDTRVLGQELPIGIPVAGHEVQLLDESGHVNPWRGEMVLGSGHLSPGYHGDPQLTAQRYFSDPDTGHHRRLLRTRDLARRLPDGQLVHAGRADRQIKIRGIRVEPGEIEAALRHAGGVQEAAVVALERAPGDWSLAAYLVMDGKPDERGLRAGLRKILPEYMIPGAFIPVPALPRLANGKINRQALPEPAMARPAVAVPPRNGIEEQLVRLWCGVLKLESIGMHDDFFALGGHSLMATRLIARVRDAFGLEVPLIALFENPTITGMADAVERTAARPADPLMPALTRRPRQAAGSAGA